MNLCDECGSNPANIHLTQIMQNETRVFHLCDECARKKGINISVQEEHFESESVSTPQIPDKECSRCGLKFSEFKVKGWLGCPTCYQSFESEIDNLLLQMHGSSLHKGKKYSGISGHQRSATGEIKRLRHELLNAIKNEEFEQAAMIRDAIHNLNRTVEHT
jgi:protein arginine kinase activator